MKAFWPALAKTVLLHTREYSAGLIRNTRLRQRAWDPPSLLLCAVVAQDVLSDYNKFGATFAWIICRPNRGQTT